MTTLFDQNLLHNGTPTSKAAAVKARQRGPTQRDAVYALLAANPGGLINDEIAAMLDIPLQSVCPRINELMEMGMVVYSGTTRRNKRDSECVVWVVKQSTKGGSSE